MLDWLDKELDKQQQKVQESERALADYRDKQNAMSLDDKQNIVTLAAQPAERRVIARAGRRRRRRKRSTTRSRAMLGGDRRPKRFPPIAQNPQVAGPQGQDRTSCSASSAPARREVRREAPGAAQANAELCRRRSSQLELEAARALQSIKNDYETAVLEEQTLRAEARSRQGRRPGSEPQERRLQRHGARGEEQPAGLRIAARSARKSCASSSNSRANNVRVVDHAEVPKCADGARRPADLAAGARASAWCWRSAVAFGLDYMNDTIKTPEDVTRRLKLPFLGLVPSVRGDKHPMLDLLARAARFRRVVPRAAHVADCRSTPARARRSLRRHQRAAARRQDDDGGEHRDGAGLRRRARAARSTPTCAGPACTARCG